jgi:hypothetical protein
MKRHVILIVTAVVVAGLAWAAFGQAGGSAGERTGRAAWRERQQKVISAIEEQLAKMKSAMESASARPANWRELPEDERAKLRAEFTKMCQERQQSITAIEDELAKLTGRRALQQEHEKSVGELNAIHELAVKEKATETAAAIEKLIATRNKAFEDRMQKLGLPQRPARTRRQGN